MALIVQKYGGTSVKDTDRIKIVAEHVAQTAENGNDVIVVVSAPAGFTDDLTQRAARISDDPSPREMDMLLSTGEQISIALLAMALQELGHDAISLTGGQMRIFTDHAHTKARIQYIDLDRVKDELGNGRIVIVAGFQGRTQEHEITTLGRGGSDTTAVAIAAALSADLCEIYTDVDGIYTADPRVVKNPSKLSKISYDEMLELASLGAKVLHPRSVEMAKTHDVPLAVRSSYDTQTGGTLVVKTEALEKEYPVTGLACDQNAAEIVIYGVDDRPGIAAMIFNALADENVNVDLIIQSGVQNAKNDIAFTVPQNELKKTRRIINSLKDDVLYERVTFDDKVMKISAVGSGMVTGRGIAATMFRVFYENGVNIDMIGTSEIKISCIIRDEEGRKEKLMQALHDAFGLESIGENEDGESE